MRIFIGKIRKMFLTSPLSPKLAAVAKEICSQCGWSISNLQLQKLLYISHMVFSGRTDKPLIDEPFEAWTYGPVVPQLYKKMRPYGADPVKDRFYEVGELDTEELSAIRDVCNQLGSATASQLVSITHREGGAWDACYESGVLNKKIPQEEIVKEYSKRA